MGHRWIWIAVPVTTLVGGFVLHGCGSGLTTDLSCTLASSFTTVETIREGSSGNIAMGVASASDGTVYVSGTILHTTSDSTWRVRRSTDRGTSWTTVDDFRSGVSKPWSIVVTPSGSVLVAGTTSNDQAWLVRRSPRGGESWSTVDQFSSPNNSSTIAFLGKDGRIWVGGNEDLGSTTMKIRLRYSDDDGLTWSEATSPFTGNVGDEWSVVRSVSPAPGRIQVAVQGGSSNFLPLRTFLSEDNGRSWTTVDVLSPPAVTGDNRLFQITAIPTGGLLAVGRFAAANGGFGAVLVGSADGRSWERVETLDFGGTGLGTRIASAGSDGFGNLYLAGDGIFSGSTRRWFVRRSSDGGRTWANLDEFDFGTTLDAAEPISIASSPLGDVFVVGNVDPTTEQTVWIVRRLSCE